jgi:hypothetical protein
MWWWFRAGKQQVPFRNDRQNAKATAGSLGFDGQKCKGNCKGNSGFPAGLTDRNATAT